MKRSLVLVLLLSGCVQPQQQPTAQKLLANLATFTTEDIEAAAKIATAAGNADDAACWSFLGSLIPTMQAPKVGVATAIEVARLGQQPTFVEKCKQSGGVFATIPALPGLPPGIGP